MEEDHFWSRSRRRLVLDLLRRHLPTGASVLDAGCGTGRLLSDLERQRYRVTGLDILPDAVLRARTRLDGGRAEVGDVTELPFADRRFDCVLLLDVLEHVDDRRALAEAARVLRANGLLVVTVPACPRLWSRRDLLAGHRRRYTRRSLIACLEETGFATVHVTHFQFLLFPLFALARLLGRSSDRWMEREERAPARLATVLEAVNRLESRLTPRARWPWGSSVVAVAVKP